MSTPAAEVFGQQVPETNASEYSVLAFVIKQMLADVATVTLVQVNAVTHSGDLSPVGFVDVVPMVHQMTGNRTAVPHGTVYNLPYLRLQGGTNAVIIDPAVGDIGMAAFCTRDISAVKASRAPAPPSSWRLLDWADGLYLGGFLNGVPQQYVQFNPEGITVSSPTQIILSAPNVIVRASQKLQVQAPDTTLGGALEVSGDVSLAATLDVSGDATIAGISSSTHTHGGVQSGSSNSAPPNP